jgi:hypothetical protein
MSNGLLTIAIRLFASKGVRICNLSTKLQYLELEPTTGIEPVTY